MKGMKIIAVLLAAGLSVNGISARTVGNSVSDELRNSVSAEAERNLVVPDETEDEKAFAEADWGWTDLGKGAQAGSAQLRLFDSPQSISVVRYRASKFRTYIANDPGEEAAATSSIAERYGAVIAINGSYFDGGHNPVTYLWDDGVQEGRIQASSVRLCVDGLVGIKRARKVIISLSDTLSYEKTARGCREVMAAGNILLQDGVSQVAGGTWTKSFQLKRHPRSVMGTTSDGWVYMIVIDGRFPEAAGATMEEAAEIARMFGLKDAINLDGGGSSTLWTASLGVLNHPSDNRKFDHDGQRKVPNIIYVK